MNEEKLYEMLVKLRDAFTMAEEVIQDFLVTMGKQATREINVASIHWVQVEKRGGAEGEFFDVADDKENGKNPDFVALKGLIEEKIKESNGKTYGVNLGKGVDTRFYWIMNDGFSVGRKPSKRGN